MYDFTTLRPRRNMGAEKWSAFERMNADNPALVPYSVADMEFFAEVVTNLARTSGLLDGIENLVANSRPTLGGERFLTDREVSARLKVSRRTLQDYRNNGMIAYYQLGGKILYKESDIEKMLAANYREAFRRVGT